MGKSKKSTVLTFSVTLPMPDGATIPDVQEYIKVALKLYKRGFTSDDPFFNTDFTNITVGLKKRETTYG